MTYLRGRSGFLVALSVAALTTLAFAPALRAPFIWDDIRGIVENPTITHLRPLPLVAPTGTAVAGRPVANLSLAVNYAVNARLGVNQLPDSSDPEWTLGYHLVNLALHLLCGALLFAILRRTLRAPRITAGWPDAAEPIAVAVTALWLVHPIVTEPVDYVVQRTELLAAFFILATLYSAIRMWASSDNGVRRRWAVAAVVSSLLGMGSKEVTVSVPVLVLLYERAFRLTTWREALRFRGARLAFYASLAATAFLPVTLVLRGSRTEGIGIHRDVAWYRYLYSQGWAITNYLGLTFWPAHLTLDYGQDTVGALAGLPGALLVLALAVATILAWRRSPPLGFVGAWFFLLLAPSSSVVPMLTEVAAERRSYLPLVAVLVMLAVGARAFGGRARWPWVVGTFCVLLAARTYARSALYADPEALWRDAVNRAPGNARASYNLAMSIVHQDPSRAEEARVILERVLNDTVRAGRISPAGKPIDSVMRDSIRKALLFGIFAASPGGAQPSPGGAPTLATATKHRMQYWVSLPKGWNPQRTWPVLVTVTGGLKDFEANARLFAAHRGDRPYIVVTPVNLTNGGQATLRTDKEYNYPSSVWDEVDREGWCAFEENGLDAVVDDVRRLYHGEDKYYIDGHSAGGHLVWLAVHTRPGALAGAITTGGNFRRRCLEDARIASAPHGNAIPIRGFMGEKDDHADALTGQFGDARAFAVSRGFTNVSFATARGEDHNPMPEVVFAFLDSLRRSH